MLNVLIGIVLLARGRARGFEKFGDTGSAFLSSLAPLLAFPLVGGLLLLLHGRGLQALDQLLQSVAVLLAAPVVSFEFARLWRREAAWLRFATAFGWCQWAVPVVAALMMLVFLLLTLLGVSAEQAALLAVCGAAGYGLWLHWFLVRRGLEVSGPRAVLVVLVMNLCTVLIVLGVPHLAQMVEAG